MKKAYKIILGIVLGLMMIFGIVIGLNYYLRAEIKSAIENQLSNSQIEYEEVNVSILDRSSSVSKPKLQLDNILMEADVLEVKKLSYTNYFLSGKIVIGAIEIKNPNVAIYKKDTLVKARDKKERPNLSKDVVIKNIHIKGGNLRFLENDSIHNKIFVSLNEFDLYNVQISDKTLQAFLPFEYERMEIFGDSVFYSINEEHHLAIKNLEIKDGDITFKDLRIIPNFSKSEFDRRIRVEKDRFELEVETVDISGLSWDFGQERIQLKSPFIEINKAYLKVYRNKLLPDDTSIKPLYSRMLREMGMKIKFDSVVLKNSRIVYEEKTNASRPPGELNFSNVNANLKNLTNIGLSSPDFPETKIKISALLMGKSPLNLNWKFDVRDPQDEFTISGDMEGISADAMNSFLRPIMNIEVEGRIQSLFYNFRGDNNLASGDMRMQYRDFKVEVLKKDGSKKNSFLSDLANIIIRNNDNSEKLERKDIKAERDKTKSFWNYLWLFLRNGSLKSFL
ncbi:hypothetical protein ACKGJN_04755 [Gillisia sp. Q332]|uniref:hypothetical protein n=1 Tax=Gillisia xinjiangensis TaxID=3384765 RepID=UPI00391AF753